MEGQNCATLTQAAIDLKNGWLTYSLRRTFETVAGETLDQPAVDLVMGHTPIASDMSARYRQRVGDDRLELVADHVRKWLFPPKKKVAKKAVTKASKKAVKKGD